MRNLQFYVSGKRPMAMKLDVLILTHPHWCHIYVPVNWVSIGSGNGLLPLRCQSITRMTTDLFRFGPLRKKPQWNLYQNTKHFLYMKMHLKMSSTEMAAILFRGYEFSFDCNPKLVIDLNNYNSIRTSFLVDLLMGLGGFVSTQH